MVFFLGCVSLVGSFAGASDSEVAAWVSGVGAWGDLDGTDDFWFCT